MKQRLEFGLRLLRQLITTKPSLRRTKDLKLKFSTALRKMISIQLSLPVPLDALLRRAWSSIPSIRFHLSKEIRRATAQFSSTCHLPTALHASVTSIPLSKINSAYLAAAAYLQPRMRTGSSDLLITAEQ